MLNNKALFVKLVALAVLIAFPVAALADGPGVAQFVKMRWPGMGRLAPDGSFYYVHNPDGLNQLYVRPAGAKDGTKLTDFPDGMAGYSMSEDGKWIAVGAGVGGNEQFGIYLLDTATQRIRALCVHPDIVYASLVWRRDSKAFAFRANDTVRSDFYVYIYDMTTNSTTRVLAEPGDWSPMDFSSDGKRLMVMKTTSATNTQFFEADLATGKHREITPKGETWAFEGIGYTGDDKSFLATSDYQGDRSGVISIDVATGKITRPFPQYAEFEMDGGILRTDRKVLALLVNEDGYSSLHLHAMPDGKPIDGPKMAKGIVGNVDFTGDWMLYSLDNANTPGTIYKWSIADASSAPVAMTTPDTQGIDVSKFRLPELVRYKSFDGLEIPAFVYLPATHKKGDKIPFVIEYHGGPEGQYRPSFNRIYQYLLSRGYGVMSPNVRGSSGYGRKYLEMDNYKNRMASVKDGVAASKWLVEQGYSAPQQVAAYGGSYGGYMVMACTTEAPEAYGAACNVVGICNLQTFLERTKDYRRKLREVEYGPLSDPEFLKSVSPIYKVDRIKAPLLIAHGANDPRVPLFEAQQLYDKLQKLGKPVEILVFPDEGHGFRKENNRITFAEKLTEFFDRHLRNPTEAGAPPAKKPISPV
jgi:dipeptidyl aminopeptidase/acylaminoacyl peptidase